MFLPFCLFCSFWDSPVSQMFDISVGNSKSLKGQAYRLDLCVSYLLFLYFLTIFFGFVLLYILNNSILFSKHLLNLLFWQLLLSQSILLFLVSSFVLFSFLSILFWLYRSNISLNCSKFLWSSLFYLCFSLCLVFNYFVFLVAGFLEMPGDV